jgi:hypothetical protein
MRLASLEFSQIDVTVLIVLVAATVPQIGYPLAFVDSSRPIKQDACAVSEPRGGDLTEVHRVVIELNTIVGVVS